MFRNSRCLLPRVSRNPPTELLTSEQSGVRFFIFPQVSPYFCEGTQKYRPFRLRTLKWELSTRRILIGQSRWFGGMVETAFVPKTLMGGALSRMDTNYNGFAPYANVMEIWFRRASPFWGFPDNGSQNEFLTLSSQDSTYSSKAQRKLVRKSITTIQSAP